MALWTWPPHPPQLPGLLLSNQTSGSGPWPFIPQPPPLYTYGSDGRLSILICFYFSRQGLTVQARLAGNLLYIPGWFGTQRPPCLSLLYTEIKGMHTKGVLEDMQVAYKHPTSMCHPLTPKPEKDTPSAVLSTREVRQVRSGLQLQSSCRSWDRIGSWIRLRSQLLGYKEGTRLLSEVGSLPDASRETASWCLGLHHPR